MATRAKVFLLCVMALTFVVLETLPALAIYFMKINCKCENQPGTSIKPLHPALDVSNFMIA